MKYAKHRDYNFELGNVGIAEEIAREAEYHSEIEDFMFKRGVSYSEAYRAVIKQKRAELERKQAKESRHSHISDMKARLG